MPDVLIERGGPYLFTPARLGFSSQPTVVDGEWQGTDWWLVRRPLPADAREFELSDVRDDAKGFARFLAAVMEGWRVAPAVELVDPFRTDAAEPGPSRWRLRIRLGGHVLGYLADAVLVSWVELLVGAGEWRWVPDADARPERARFVLVLVVDGELRGILAPRRPNS